MAEQTVYLGGRLCIRIWPKAASPRGCCSLPPPWWQGTCSSSFTTLRTPLYIQFFCGMVSLFIKIFSRFFYYSRKSTFFSLFLHLFCRKISCSFNIIPSLCEHFKRAKKELSCESSFSYQTDFLSVYLISSI